MSQDQPPPVDLDFGPKRPREEWSPQEKRAAVKLIVFEAQGVLLAAGSGLKDPLPISPRDEAALARWQEQGGAAACLALKASEPLTAWCAERRVAFRPHLGKQDIELQLVALEHDAQPYQVCYLGCSLADMPAMARAGLAAAPADADSWVRDLAHYVTADPAGEGALAQVIEWLLAPR